MLFLSFLYLFLLFLLLLLFFFFFFFFFLFLVLLSMLSFKTDGCGTLFNSPTDPSIDPSIDHFVAAAVFVVVVNDDAAWM